MVTLVLFTGTILFLIPSGYRVWGAAGFTLLYLGGAIAVWRALRKILREDPFPETLRQIKQDGIWLDSFSTRN